MIAEFAKILDIPQSLLIEKKNERGGSGRISDLRQICWKLLFDNGYYYSEIADLFNRDRSTVFLGIKRINQLLEIGDKNIVRIHELVKHVKNPHES